MGNYESLKIGATVEVENTGEDLISLIPKLDAELSALLADEVREAIELTNTPDSYILSWRNK